MPSLPHAFMFLPYSNESAAGRGKRDAFFDENQLWQSKADRGVVSI